MNTIDLKYCPGTLSEGYDTYSSAALKRVFDGHKVHHQLIYDSPNTNKKIDDLLWQNTKRISISGVQEKYSVVLDKNKLRLTKNNEQGTYILKPIPYIGKNADQMPANEHLTMQIARQLYDIETAENAMIFFKNGAPAYITKRFDVAADNSKWATEDLASLSNKTPQTHGIHFKYAGNYAEMFDILKLYLPIYKIEASKLFKLIVFNYLFSNGDAHWKNFSIIETPDGDFRLSPAYDLLNTKLHVTDSDFALEEGLLPKKLAKGPIKKQLIKLAEVAGLSENQTSVIIEKLLSKSDKVNTMIDASFLDEKFKRTYLQTYQAKYKQLMK
jgi:serine/threonine-protein kinase HipA